MLIFLLLLTSFSNNEQYNFYVYEFMCAFIVFFIIKPLLYFIYFFNSFFGLILFNVKKKYQSKCPINAFPASL